MMEKSSWNGPLNVLKFLSGIYDITEQRGGGLAVRVYLTEALWSWILHFTNFDVFFLGGKILIVSMIAELFSASMHVIVQLLSCVNTHANLLENILIFIWSWSWQSYGVTGSCLGLPIPWWLSITDSLPGIHPQVMGIFLAFKYVPWTSLNFNNLLRWLTNSYLHSWSLCHWLTDEQTNTFVFLPLDLSGRRDIVVACICLSVHPSVLPTVRLSLTWACPHNNSWQVWAGISKLAPNMHPGILSAGIKNRGHWPWPSRSFWLFWLRIIGNPACLW